MKAVIYSRYGGPEVLQLTDLPKPIPRHNEILIKTFATSVTAGDWRMRSANPFIVRFFAGLFNPSKVSVLGFEISGVIEDIGKNVELFKKGDPVFAACGFKFGGYAEYKCLVESATIAIKPVNMSFAEAATVPIGGLTALRMLRKAGLKNSDQILIYGASGSVGTFAVQIAKSMGAHVTAVCSTANVEMVKSLGAEEVIDYTKEDYTKLSSRFDIITDAVGKIRKKHCKHLLKPDGNYLSVGGFMASGPVSDMYILKELIESGKVKSVIDRTYTLEQIREAHTYVQGFHKKGNVSIQIVSET